MLGAPGAGKGTQAEQLSELLGIPVLTMSSVLKSIISGESELGQQIRALMAKGDLAPDDLIWRCLCNELQHSKYRQGVIFDGVPRTVGQFDLMVEDGMQIDKVFVLQVADDVLVDRLSGRLMDPATERIYHKRFLPEGMSEAQKSRLVARPDDAPDVVRKRLAVYHETTAPIIQAMRSNQAYKDVMVDVDASLHKDAVWQAIKNHVHR
tara:strand:- start:236 stop:859 length:624 start_codon:yes stop_codon:yes gene_type:complete